MTNRSASTVLKNERGQLTLDFIFALTIAFGFTFIFIAITFTLSMVEVGQYITYATSRAYMGSDQFQHSGDGSPSQQGLAMSKFAEITGTPVIAAILKTGWIKLGPPTVSNFGPSYPESNAENAGIAFVGAQVPFQATILNVQLPLLGSTATQTTTGKATLNSYLLREVSSNECETIFDQQRYATFLQIMSGLGFPYAQVSQATQGAPAPPWVPTDNGC